LLVKKAIIRSSYGLFGSLVCIAANVSDPAVAVLVLACVVGVVGVVGIVGIVGMVGVVGVVGMVGIVGIVGIVGMVGMVGIIGIVGVVGIFVLFCDAVFSQLHVLCVPSLFVQLLAPSFALPSTRAVKCCGLVAPAGSWCDRFEQSPLSCFCLFGTNCVTMKCF
jgi:hypothetical protein